VEWQNTAELFTLWGPTHAELLTPQNQTLQSCYSPNSQPLQSCYLEGEPCDHLRIDLPICRQGFWLCRPGWRWPPPWCTPGFGSCSQSTAATQSRSSKNNGYNLSTEQELFFRNCFPNVQSRSKKFWRLNFGKNFFWESYSTVCVDSEFSLMFFLFSLLYVHIVFKFLLLFLGLCLSSIIYNKHQYMYICYICNIAKIAKSI
jgi:hypothetical protein